MVFVGLCWSIHQKRFYLVLWPRFARAVPRYNFQQRSPKFQAMEALGAMLFRSVLTSLQYPAVAGAQPPQPLARHGGSNPPGRLSKPQMSLPRILEGFYEMSSTWTWWEFGSPAGQAVSLPPAITIEEIHAPMVCLLPPLSRLDGLRQVCRHPGGGITDGLIQRRRIERPVYCVLPHGRAIAV